MLFQNLSGLCIYLDHFHPIAPEVSDVLESAVALILVEQHAATNAVLQG